MSPANKDKASKYQPGNFSAVQMPDYKKQKTIKIEIDSEQSDPKLMDGEMSPAYRNNLNFKRAAAKMPAVG